MGSEIPDILRIEALIEHGVKAGDGPCLIGADEVWSRDRFLTEMAHVKTALENEGFEPGDIVAVRMGRTPQLVVTLCGILSAGGVYLPLDPGYPDARLEYMREDSGAMFEITESGISRLSEGKRTSETDGLAYLIYTSGSTGKPKGVAVTHANVVNFLNSMIDCPGLSKSDRLLAVTTPSFDISVLELFAPLAAGGQIVLADEMQVRDGNALSKLIAEHDISVMQATPSTWRLLLDAGWSGNGKLKALCGGEELTPSLARGLLPSVGQLWNMYGPTETTVWSSCAQITSAEDIHLGMPIAATDIRIMSDEGRALGSGKAGEIYIGGTGVTAGYWHRPELTAQKFVTLEDGSMFFRTGDSGLIDENCNLRFRGRLDRQIKLRGHRIEPEEIERVIARLPGVDDAAVVVSMDGDIPAAIVAHVAPHLDSHHLLQLVATELPAAMVPGELISHDSLPRLPNGKIDRKALADTASSDTPLQSSEMTATEQIISEVFADILKRDVTDAGTNFFELGGHSLLAARALAQLRAKTGTALPLRAIFEAETITALAEEIDVLSSKETEPTAVEPVTKTHKEETSSALSGGFKIDDTSGGIQLTPSQERMWSHGALYPDLPLYVIPAAFEVTGALDRERFTAAFDRVASHYDIFRLRIQDQEQSLSQGFRSSPSGVEWIDVSNDPTPEARLDTEIERVCRSQLDLTIASPVRATLVSLSPTRHWLLMGIHHLAWDGHSFKLFLNALATAYHMSDQNLPDSPQFGAYAQAPVTINTDHLEWWKAHLKTPPPPPELPLDKPRPALFDHQGAALPVQISTTTLTAIRQLAAAQRTTSFSVFTAAFSAFLSRLDDSDDRIIGLVSDERPEAYKDCLGNFVNTVLLRDRAAKGMSFEVAVQAVASAVPEVLCHPVPLAEVIEAAGFPLEPSRPTGAQVLVSHQYSEERAPNLGEAQLRRVDLPPRVTAFELALEILEADEAVTAEIQYASSLFSTEQATAITAAFGSFLENAVLRPAVDIANVFIAPSEMQSAYATLNDTATNETPPSALQAFLNHAQKNTDHNAIVFKGQSLTYGELAARSHALAAGLAEAGAAPGKIVGIALERSPDMAASVLAIWMTGAAYLPLDPEHPEARRQLMIEDAGCEMIIGEEPGHLSPDSLVDKGNGQTPPVVPGDIAYVMYTSGSTGRPKGVVNGHAQVANFLRAMAKKPGCGPEERLLAITTLSFDISILELFLPLSVGGTVILPDRDEAIDGDDLSRLVTDHDATIMQGTPASWRLLLDAGWNGKEDMTALCGGEALPADLVETLLPKVASLWNMYGPTEATIWSTVKQITSPERISIGTPIDNTVTYIVDGEGTLCPPGISGELWIGGQGVAMGYYGQSFLTAERFLPDPFSSDSNAMVYRTGDRARLTPDGQLMHLGRMDTQLKLRGFRIEAGEIEAALSDHEDISEAVCIVREQAGGEGALTAYFTLTGPFAPTGSDLRRWLRKRLPNYMIPQIFVELDHLPLTPNGKIDRRALPAPAGQGAEQREFISPTTPHEKALAEIWSEILKTERVSATDNFFELGGQSLQAARVATIFRSRTKARIQPRALIFETLAQLAAGAVPETA